MIKQTKNFIKIFNNLGVALSELSNANDTSTIKNAQLKKKITIKNKKIHPKKNSLSILKISLDDKWQMEKEIKSTLIKNTSNIQKPLIFLDNRGWELKMKICDSNISVGPFISQLKATAVANFVIENKSHLDKMTTAQRKEWIKMFYDLIECLLI